MGSFSQIFAKNYVKVIPVDAKYKTVKGKKIRIKHVFDNSQVAHVWAQQTQEFGRNGKETIYFDGDSIYSYGPHYLAGKIHEVDGKRIALINSKSYSVSTTRHVSYVKRSVRGLMPHFEVPNPSELKHVDNVNHFYNEVFNAISRIFSTSKVTSACGVKYPINNINTIVKNANAYFNIIGVKPIIVDQGTMEAIKAHLKKRFARYLELNSPEIVADRVRVKRELFEKYNAIRIATLNDRLEEWKSGKSVLSYVDARLLNLKYDLIRVRNNTIETSGGASVPLNDAIVMYKALAAGMAKSGMGVGNFKLTSIDKCGSDTIVTVGCHKFLLSDIASTIDAHLNRNEEITCNVLPL